MNVMPSEISSRSNAKKIHAEYRERALQAPEITARWMLVAAAGGALACLNGIVSSDINSEIAKVLATGITFYVLSISLTLAGLSYANHADTEDMILWYNISNGFFDDKIEEIELSNDRSQNLRKWSGRLMMWGGFVFMITSTFGGWWIYYIVVK